MKNIVIKTSVKGSFDKTFSFLKSMKEKKFLKNLPQFGEEGVRALAAATPKDTGLTANSWKYEIVSNEYCTYINWYNTNVIKDYYNVALMIQTGHGTKQGVWIEGIDYINPALQPIFDKIAKDIWEVVTTS